MVCELLVSLFYNCCYYIVKQQYVVECICELFVKSFGYVKFQIQGDYVIVCYFLQYEVSVVVFYLVFLYVIICDDKYWLEICWQEFFDLLVDSGVYIKLLWGVLYEEVWVKWLVEGWEYVEVLLCMSFEQVVQVLVGVWVVVLVDIGLSYLIVVLDKLNFMFYGLIDLGLIGGYGKNQYIVWLENSVSIGDIVVSWIYFFL